MEGVIKTMIACEAKKFSILSWISIYIAHDPINKLSIVELMESDLIAILISASSVTEQMRWWADYNYIDRLRYSN